MYSAQPLFAIIGENQLLMNNARKPVKPILKNVKCDINVTSKLITLVPPTPIVISMILIVIK